MAMALAQAAVDRLTRLDEEVTAVRESDEVKFDGRKRKRPERGQNKVVRKWVARNEPASVSLVYIDLQRIYSADIPLDIHSYLGPIWTTS